MRKPILKPRATVDDGIVRLDWLKSTPLFSAGEQEEFARFRIYRGDEAFVFGEDYEEYFLNSSHRGAELVFDGSLECAGRRRYAFEDRAVDAGRTYSYWIQTANSDPIGPLPVRVRHPEVWWSCERLRRELDALAAASPELVRLSVCGQTVHGRDIPVVRVGSGPLSIGLVVIIHGGESGPELIVPALQRLVREQPHLLDAVQVVAVPSVNMDERERLVCGTPWYLRTNPQGVDLNRNFPAQWDQVEYGYGLDSSDPTSGTYRGPGPGSAPETQAVMAALDPESLDLVLSYHCLASICSLPALAARAGSDCPDYTRRCQRAVEVLTRGLHPELADSGDLLRFGCSAGSLPAWLYERAGVPAFDLESGADAEALQKCRYDRTDVELLEDYQQRHYRSLIGVMQSLARGDL